MPKTPGQNEPAKSNPFITKGISRSLLTPCRQVGLSRKRKTPASSNSHSAQVQKVNNSVDNLQTTPVSSNVSLIGGTEISNIKPTSTSRETTDKKKRKVSKRLITDNDTGEATLLPVSKDVTQIDTSITIFSDDKLSCMPLDDNESIINAKSDLLTSKVKIKKKRCLDTDEEDGFTIKNNKIEKDWCPSKTAKKGNSIAENQIVADPVVTTTIEVKLKNNLVRRERKTVAEEEKQMKSTEEGPIKIKSIEISPQDVLLDKTNKDEVKQKTKKIKRSLSLKKSTEDSDSEKYSRTPNLKLKECSVSLSPLRNSDIHPKISSSDIQDLEKMIKEKQKIVDDLRQAEIYKKKHNLQELQELTSQWKTGCISALNDLLPQLQTHATIDMASLLNNLRVPKNLITMSQSGELN